jgi:hypothetical protein
MIAAQEQANQHKTILAIEGRLIVDCSDGTEVWSMITRQVQNFDMLFLEKLVAVLLRAEV